MAGAVYHKHSDECNWSTAASHSRGKHSLDDATALALLPHSLVLRRQRTAWTKWLGVHRGVRHGQRDSRRTSGAARADQAARRPWDLVVLLQVVSHGCVEWFVSV